MAERIAAYETVVKWSKLTSPPSTYGNATTISVGEWSLNVNTDLVDVTTTGDSGFRYFIPGLKSSEGSVKFYHEDATDLPIKPGEKGKFELFVDTAANITKSYIVPCTIGNVEISATIDGAVEATVNYQGRGAVSGDLYT
jgi:hypothetical protein